MKVSTVIKIIIIALLVYVLWYIKSSQEDTKVDYFINHSEIKS